MSSFLAHRRKSFRTFQGFGNASRDFDGTGDYITIPDSASFPTGAQTWCCWIKVDVLETAVIMSHNQSTGDNRSVILYITSDGKMNVTVNNLGTSGGNRTASSSASAIGTTNWHHVALAFTPSTHVKCYVDGSEAGSNTTSIPASVFNSADDASIGAYADGVFEFDGKICDCRIYDADIGATNISDLYNGVDYQTNLVGWWLDDDDDVLDNAGANDGTNNGSTYDTDGPNG